MRQDAENVLTAIAENKLTWPAHAETVKRLNVKLDTAARQIGA
jgi:hypothetical protein